MPRHNVLYYDHEWKGDVCTRCNITRKRELPYGSKVWVYYSNIGLRFKIGKSPNCKIKKRIDNSKKILSVNISIDRINAEIKNHEGNINFNIRQIAALEREKKQLLDDLERYTEQEGV